MAITTQLILDIAARVNQIDARVSAHVTGGMIHGTFRGKTSENYKYNVAAGEFVYNNEGPNVKKAIEKAVSELIITGTI